MAQRKRRVRSVQDDFEMPLSEVVAALLPNHEQRPGDVWTFFARDGVLEMTVTRAPEDI